MTTDTKSKEKLICPGCGKPQRNIRLHVKTGCPGRNTDDSAVGAIPGPSLPPDFMYAIQSIADGVQNAQTMAKSAMERTDAAIKIVPDIVSTSLNQSLPSMIDQMLTARLDQLTAQLQTGQPVASGDLPAQGSGKSGALADVLPLLLNKMLKGESAEVGQGPVNALVTQVEQLGALIGAIDRIRGINPQGQQGQMNSNMSPKTALDWAKWGHSLGTKGAPEPDFDVSKTTVPPGPST